MRSEFGEGINPYALDFPVCTEDKNDSPNAAQRTTSSTQSKLLLSLMDGPPFLPQQDEYNPCQEEHLHTYLNRWGVQTALHAHVGSKWKACSDTLHYDWKDVNTAQIHLYTKLVEMGKTGNQSLDILIYSGDDDSVCSTTGTQEWIYDLNVRVKKDQEWEPWSVGDQTAGFYTKFDMGNNVDATLTFVTVHGAGHEVPAYRPMESLELFRKYLARDW
jgi:carboxypeptidase C (cathepsin A)